MDSAVLKLEPRRYTTALFLQITKMFISYLKSIIKENLRFANAENEFKEGLS